MAGTKRNWVEYERRLKERKARFVQFLIYEPSKKEIEEELRRMNKSKVGRKYEVPDSAIMFAMLLKAIYGIDDRSLAHIISRLVSKIRRKKITFSHVALIKRRRKMKDKIMRMYKKSYSIKDIEGKVVYVDGSGIKIGKSGFYRNNEYEHKPKFIKVVIATNEEGKCVGISIGNEKTAEIKLFKEKMLNEIIRKKAKTFVGDGAYFSKEIIIKFINNRIKPIIKAPKHSKDKIKRKPVDRLGSRTLIKMSDEIIDNVIREQIDLEWHRKSGYTKRWVYSEGFFSNFKRLFGDEVVHKKKDMIETELLLKCMIYNKCLG